jgi:choline dehydrogenase-like flavoprotein
VTWTLIVSGADISFFKGSRFVDEFFEYEVIEIKRCCAGHHLGTARMSDATADGVVDANCRGHEMLNLCVAGGAVFPTSSQANPTLTIVALAVHLAEHLKSSPE